MSFVLLKEGKSIINADAILEVGSHDPNDGFHPNGGGWIMWKNGRQRNLDAAELNDLKAALLENALNK